MEDKIRLRMGDWLYNAGLVGLINILQHAEAGDSLVIHDQSLEIDSTLLEGFEDKYFDYFVDKYEKVMTFTNVKKRIQLILNLDIDEKTLNKDYKEDIKYIKDKLKNSAYKNILNIVPKNELKKPTQGFFQNLLILLDNEKKEILKKECIGYYDQKAKTSKSPNAIIDKYINTNMLNIQKSCDEILNYINEDTSKYKFDCFSCGNPIKSIDKGLSFMTNIFFDTSRKTSHVWNFVSDIEMCPICSLVYFCVPAGFTTVYGKGIYVNQNLSLNSAVAFNNRIKSEILKDHEVNRSLTYRGLINAINEQSNMGIKYELADMQVVKYNDNQYRFNILSNKMLNIISNSKDDLNNIINCGFKEVNAYFNIYELVIDRIFNNQNLFTLIHKLLIYKLTIPKDCRFSMRQLIRILNINLRIMEGMGDMEKSDKDMIKQANASGYYLRQEYRGKGAKDKLNDISYRFLNALKTGNKNMFMDTLLNCYLYVQKTVPNIFLDALKDDEQYKTIGYAFVTGLVEGKENNKQDGGNK